MTLQTRVTALEMDVAALRSRMDNADVERDSTNRQLADLRAETRGWAQIAIRADQKLDAAGELLQLIYADLRQANEKLNEHDRRFDAVDERFDAVDGRFDAVDRRFDGVDGRFDGVDRRFDGVDRRFDGVDERFDAVDRRFDRLDEKLQQILDRAG